MRRVLPVLAAAVLAAALLFAPPGATARAACGAQACPQEHLTYHLRWGPVPVGSAVLATQPHGAGCMHRVTARSNLLVDLVATVRDEIVARTDCAGTRSIHYAKTMHEGSVHRDYSVRFEGGAALRVNRPDGSVERLETGPVLDPLSVLFWFRRQEYGAEGGQASVPVSDGRVLETARARFVGRERTAYGGRRIESLVFDVSTGRADGLFTMQPGAAMRIWVTDDALRIPLRLRARVVVAGFEGTFTATLLHAERDGRMVLEL